MNGKNNQQTDKREFIHVDVYLFLFLNRNTKLHGEKFTQFFFGENIIQKAFHPVRVFCWNRKLKSKSKVL